jgi:hypothetical protein
LTKDEARAIRCQQLQGDPVTALDLQEAIFTLSKRRDKRMVLPPLPRPVQELADATLCFNLGRAIRG